MYRRLSSPHLVFGPRSLPSTKCRYFGRQPDNTSSDPSRQDFLCLLAKQFSSIVHSVASFLQPDDLGMVQRRGSVLPDRRSPQLSKQWESDTLHTPLIGAMSKRLIRMSFPIGVTAKQFSVVPNYSYASARQIPVPAHLGQVNF